MFLAEITAVKDKAYLLISVFQDLINHKGELGYICNRTRILFIKEWNPVCFIHGDRKIEYWKSLIILGFSKLDNADVSCFTVLVRGIIRNIDTALMIAPGIPVIQETNTQINRD